jgi:hypothetical protein
MPKVDQNKLCILAMMLLKGLEKLKLVRTRVDGER